MVSAYLGSDPDARPMNEPGVPAAEASTCQAAPVAGEIALSLCGINVS
jgi:hypothetical protein